MGVDPYLSDLMRLHGFSIQSMETLAGAAPTWRDARHNTTGCVSLFWKRRENREGKANQGGET